MRKTGNPRLAFAAAGVLAIGIFVSGPRAGAARLVAVQEIQQDMCAMPPLPPDPSEARADWIERWQQNAILQRQLEQQPTMFAAAFAQGVPERQTTPERRRVQQLPALRAITRKPEPRILGDTYPTFTAIGVFPPLNQIVIQDNNLWGYNVFNRLDNTPPDAEFQKPKRSVQGDITGIQYNNGLYIDQTNGDIYSIESDVGDAVSVFRIEADGNVKAARELVTPHRGFALAVDEQRGELYASVEYPPKIAVYAKTAAGRTPPLRILEGDATKIGRAHV